MNIKKIAVIAFVSFSIIAFNASAEYQDGDSGQDSNTASLQVKISELEEHIHKLEGRIEEVSFENKQLKNLVDKSEKDVEYRLNELEKKSSSVATNPAQPQIKPDNETAPSDDSAKLTPVENPTNSDNEVAKSTQKFATSREHYNYAFKLLNQSKYDEAGASFSGFVNNYPKDPLVGNAYYWLGETYYVRRDYVKSADNFRLGYQALPTGPKASDNLLKLAMSLNALKKNKEACVVLKQIEIKFANSSNKTRAEQEISRMGCDN